jgi:hypothetical protein
VYTKNKTFAFKYEMVAGSFLHKAPGNTGNRGLACNTKKFINEKRAGSGFAWVHIRIRSHLLNPDLNRKELLIKKS